MKTKGYYWSLRNVLKHMCIRFMTQDKLDIDLALTAIIPKSWVIYCPIGRAAFVSAHALARYCHAVFILTLRVVIRTLVHELGGPNDL